MEIIGGLGLFAVGFMTGCGTVKSNLEGNRKNHTDAMLSDFGTVVTYFPGIRDW